MRGTETAANDPPKGDPGTPREGKGRLSNPPQRRLSPTEISALIKEYRNGATITQLATVYGVHRHTITEWLDRRGIERRSTRQQWTQAELDRARTMYDHGRSLTEVGAEFGIQHTTVANRFRRAGINVRPRPGWTAT